MIDVPETVTSNEALDLEETLHPVADLSDGELEAAAGTRTWDLVSQTPSSNLPCC